MTYSSYLNCFNNLSFDTAFICTHTCMCARTHRHIHFTTVQTGNEIAFSSTGKSELCLYCKCTLVCTCVLLCVCVCVCRWVSEREREREEEGQANLAEANVLLICSGYKQDIDDTLRAAQRCWCQDGATHEKIVSSAPEHDFCSSRSLYLLSSTEVIQWQRRVKRWIKNQQTIGRSLLLSMYVGKLAFKSQILVCSTATLLYLLTALWLPAHAARNMIVLIYSGRHYFNCAMHSGTIT